MEKPVAGYFRVSRARDGMSAPDLYRVDIERYCDYRKLDLAEIFEDIDFSGWRGSKQRPGLEALKARRHDFSCVVIPKLSRFGRSVRDLVSLFDLFDQDDIALVFLDMNVDTGTSQGRLLRHVMAAFAEYESDVKSDYARANQELLARKGLPSGGPAPFGYVRRNKTFAVDQRTAQLVRGIFTRYVAGETMNAIAKDLNNRGIPSPGGAKWSATTIGVLIRKPVYVSLRQFRGELIGGSWEGLVERKVWASAQDLNRSEPKAGRYIGQKKLHALLYGLLFCGECGRKLHYRTHMAGQKYHYACPESRKGTLGPARCRNGTISATRAEQIVVDAFKDRFWILFSDDSTLRDQRLTSLERNWDTANARGKAEILAAHIDRVTLLQRSPGQSRHGARGARCLDISWLAKGETLETAAEQLPDDLQRRTCSKCRQRKAFTDFARNRSKNSGRAGWCRDCSRAYDRQRTRGNREAGGAYHEEWRKWLNARIRFPDLSSASSEPSERIHRKVGPGK